VVAVIGYQGSRPHAKGALPELTTMLSHYSIYLKNTLFFYLGKARAILFNVGAFHFIRL
jgi:hypothetical protein